MTKKNKAPPFSPRLFRLRPYQHILFIVEYIFEPLVSVVPEFRTQQDTSFVLWSRTARKNFPLKTVSSTQSWRRRQWRHQRSCWQRSTARKRKTCKVANTGCSLALSVVQIQHVPLGCSQLTSLFYFLELSPIQPRAN